MRLPELTPLQFLAISLLFSGEQTSGQLRRRLRQCQGPSTPTAFCMLMRRMQRAGYVEGRRGCRRSAGRSSPQCRYRVTELGVLLWSRTREFYLALARPPADLEPAPSDQLEFADYPPKQRKALLTRKVARQLNRAVSRIVRHASRSRGRRRA